MTWNNVAWHEGEGFEVIAEYDQGASYEFDIHLFFKDPQGRFFYGNDSGCSCPTPWENHNKESDYHRVFNVAEVRALIEEDGRNYRWPGNYFYKAVEKAFADSARAE